MFKYLRFLSWVVVKEVLPALRKAMASRLGQKNQTGRKRKKEGAELAGPLPGDLQLTTVYQNRYRVGHEGSGGGEAIHHIHEVTGRCRSDQSKGHGTGCSLRQRVGM